jgi:protein-L-isoaspartate(D-aspartate) O-methyltransferase
LIGREIAAGESDRAAAAPPASSACILAQVGAPKLSEGAIESEVASSCAIVGEGGCMRRAQRLLRRSLMFEHARHEMVETQLVQRGITDPTVLTAFHAVAREVFVPDSHVPHAYGDLALPIGEGETLPAPYVVASTLAALRLEGGERVLEVGTGSGYLTALLAEICGEVYTVERRPALALHAEKRLALLGYENVYSLIGDGTHGWPQHAPFDVIAVAAGGPSIPRPLVRQLKPGGRLLIPVGSTLHSQMLVRITKNGDGELVTEPLLGVNLTPLVGEHGWPEGH